MGGEGQRDAGGVGPGRVTRRGVVVGGVVAVAAMGVGSWVAVERSSPLRRQLHARGLLDGPDRVVPPGEDADDVVYATLDGPDGRRYVWGLWTPAGAEPALCVVCLHGKAGDERTAFETLGVHRFVADAGLPWAVATIDGGTDYWHPRASGADPEGAVTAGLLPVLADRLGADVRYVALGWSMGGYGVLLLGEEQPEAFAAIVAASPALWTSFDDAAQGAFDDREDFGAHDVLAGAAAFDGGPPVRVDCGADDVFAGPTRTLLDTVDGIGGGIHAGFHDAATWRSFLPAQLSWIRDVTAGGG